MQTWSVAVPDELFAEHAPIWLDLSAGDPEKARSFYSKVFGWKIDVNPDPQYGGYALAKLGGKDVAGIGPKQDPSGPTAWLVYVGTGDADETAGRTRSMMVICPDPE